MKRDEYLIRWIRDQDFNLEKAQRKLLIVSTRLASLTNALILFTLDLISLVPQMEIRK